MVIRQTSLIEVRRTRSKGRGIFATAFIAEGTVFEQAPVLVMPAREMNADQEDTVLSHYTFAWGKNTVAVALGFGSLYNHSYSPNACYEDVSGQMKNYIAIRDIQAGEEVTINYNGDANSTEPVWFDVIESKPDAAPELTKAKTAVAPKKSRRTKAETADAKNRSRR
jgi:SET domain-containing protein